MIDVLLILAECLGIGGAAIGLYVLLMNGIYR